MIVRNDFDITAGASNTRLDARLYFPDTGKSVEFMHDNIANNNDLSEVFKNNSIIYTY